jgi:hypothetical protein
MGEPTRAALSNATAGMLHVRRQDGGASARLFLTLVGRDELEQLTIGLVYCLSQLGEASDESLQQRLLELEAAA